MKKDTANIILQSHPMVDYLLSTSPNGAKGRLYIKKDNLYNSHGHLGELGLIEHVIQCSIAKANYEKQRHGGNHAIGTVGEIKRFALNFLPKIEETIESSIRLINRTKGATNAIASIYVQGEVAATCRIRITLKEQ